MSRGQFVVLETKLKSLGRTGGTSSRSRAKIPRTPVRPPREAFFRATAAVRRVPAPIPAGSKLIGLVRVLGKSLEVPAAKKDWLKRQLPPEEAKSVHEARLHRVFPIVVGAESAEALLVLGPKRSEEPYSREDQTPLEAVTANLALLSVHTRVRGALPIAGAAPSG